MNMDNKPKYSVLCITRNVTDDIIYKIIKYLCDGVKVSLISNNEVRLTEKNKDIIEIWNKAINEGLLQIIVEDSIDISKNSEYFDGNISEEIKEFLSKTKFNMNQFLIEHSNINANIKAYG